MSRFLKWILGITGALVVGALGNGLWSGVLAPLGTFLMKGALSVLTLGISAAKDSVYKEASFGFHEGSGDSLIALIALAIVAIPFILYATDPEFAFQRVGSRLRNPFRRRLRGILLIMMAFMGSLLCMQIMFGIYANTLTANFQRNLSVASPHISSDERNVFLARFAKIRNRKDFLIIFEELNSIAEKNGEKRSDFSPW